MKQLIAVFALASVSVFIPVSANGFAPWESADRTEVRSLADAAQRDIEIRSFYRSNNAAREDFRGESQADIQIVPWYAADRV